jgi:hypothetical protein
MKHWLIALILVSLSMIGIPAVSGYEDVGGSFGSSWLDMHGTKPVSTTELQNNLWNWGAAPKGYSLYNSVLYPPGYAPQWFYPAIPTGYAPIVINNTQATNYLTGIPQSTSSAYIDPWLLSQLSGREIVYIREPKSLLF